MREGELKRKLSERNGLRSDTLFFKNRHELDLDLMVGKNTAQFETPFTVSVDLIGHGTSTGISAYDRCASTALDGGH